MKSYLIGRPADIGRVYSGETLAALQTEAGLDSTHILTKETLPEASAADADILFSTWGMPLLTEEEIGRYFPHLKAVFYAAGTVQGFARPFLSRGIPGIQRLGSQRGAGGGIRRQPDSPGQ